LLYLYFNKLQPHHTVTIDMNNYKHRASKITEHCMYTLLVMIHTSYNQSESW